jgi:hypothetical protein
MRDNVLRAPPGPCSDQLPTLYGIISPAPVAVYERGEGGREGMSREIYAVGVVTVEDTQAEDQAFGV